ncbi:cap-specific mRNA (nucleoside-2'-O-)-methyltransferase 1-like [Venturia canescens]|uniref:cap-specific mRNA (nucleoside-2'-O-)-methyltransferase 1-like n=1 Tax=Venturia canescens TaxID=32260 RepID=UPI001C9C501F|nr:cap-specific mRNA (nucleoside-2'-O-)-methyltransferase 1-like [Venturia canescens]
MDDMQGRRLSDSMSSLSGEGSPSFEQPSFNTSEREGLNNGRKKRRLDDSGLEWDTLEKPAKKMALEAEFDMADKAKRMMEKMGYKKGAGLGKHGQGRLEPVEASQQKGRRGLGHYNEKLKEANLRWDPSKEEILIEEEINWLMNTKEPPCIKDLNDWIKIGPTKRTIEDETLYCDAAVVSGVVGSKSVFDNLDKNEMRRARTRSNPFETIRGSIFLNRAAVKMANMDRACNFLFTAPTTLKSNELLYFADVCAGPGGFSEYVLWRKKWHAKGFGFTLRESNDFKLEDFYAGSPDTFHPFYGPKGDGDVYNPENQEAFRQLIMRQTHGNGVHFMMSDGGFSVEGEESVQEILSKQLYLCQCLVALMIVREKGHFVTKLFDIFTPFSAGLVYIMSRCFESISIFKPNTSRPANSERYLICNGKQSNVTDVIEYLSRVNRILLNQDKSRDVMQLVPHEILEEDEEFFKYLKNSNEVLGRRQIVGLLKIAAFCEDTTLMENRQAEMRKKCLEYWGLPDTSRTIPRISAPGERLKVITQNSTMSFMTTKPKILETSNLNKLLNVHYDWFCMLCDSSGQINDKSATFYIGMGKSNSYRYDNGTWIRVPNLHLSPDTLVFAELVTELRGEYTQQRRTSALHILDSYFLGGEDVSQKYIEERYRLTKLYTEALWKPMNGEWIRVRAKELHPLTENLEERFNLQLRTLKKGGQVLTHVPSRDDTHYEDTDDPYFIVPKSVVFFKSTAHYWSRHVSQSSGYPYYYNWKDKRTLYDKDKPACADASFAESFENRIVWCWPPDPALTRESLFEMIRNKCVRPVNR